jgi:ectoine hydroxylase-related dioxygenase (phytanoyl-CoA dioxygenase family)
MSAAICIDRCTEQNGAVEFLPGFHDRLLTEPGIAADPDESMFPSFVLAIAEPGDILIFAGLKPHRSGGNRSDACRRMLFLTYSRDKRPNLYEHYQQLRGTFFRRGTVRQSDVHTPDPPRKARTNVPFAAGDGCQLYRHFTPLA